MIIRGYSRPLWAKRGVFVGNRVRSKPIGIPILKLSKFL
jgi:hypothetical protein